MDKLREVISNLEAARQIILNNRPASNSKRQLWYSQLEQVEMQLDQYKFQLKKLERN